MQASSRNNRGNLELSRLTLASLAVWLAVTCLVACNQTTPTASGTATAAVTPAADAALPVATIPAATSSATTVEVATVEEREQLGPRTEPASAEVALTQSTVVADASTPAAVEKLVVAAAVNAADSASRFVFSADAGGQILAAKLSPPSQFEFRPVPYISEPKPWRTLRFDPLPRDTALLTRTLIPNDPWPLTPTALPGLSLKSLDLPSLPHEIAPSVPTPLVVSPQPLSYVPSPNADQVPFLAVSPAPPKEKIDAASDPSRASVGVALFQPRFMATPFPTDFLKLAIPEPFEQIRAVQLNYTLAEFDLTLFPAGRPSQPHFPLIELPAEPKK
jgi:hypothetical protein